MTRCLKSLAVIAFAAISTVAQAQQVFRAIQTGAQEVPPTGSAATGDFNIILTGCAGSYQISFTGSYSGLGTPYSASHLHQAPVGVSGPVVLNLAANHTPITPISGSWQGRFVPVSDALAKALVSGLIYVNTHSNGFPGGEIRGQMLPVPGQSFHAKQIGANEVPPNASPATGPFDLVLHGSPGSYAISFAGGYQGLMTPYSASHLHQAAAGVNGPVVVNLATQHTPITPTSGTWLGFAVPVSDVIAWNLLAGNIYINTHTTGIPGGEIRDQLGAPISCDCYADCDGDGVLSIDDFICFQTFFALGC